MKNGANHLTILGVTGGMWVTIQTQAIPHIHTNEQKRVVAKSLAMTHTLGVWGACSQALTFLMAGGMLPGILPTRKRRAGQGERSTGLSLLLFLLKPSSSGQPVQEEG